MKGRVLGATYWPKKDNRMNDGGINVREGVGDISPVLLVMTMVSCYLCCVSLSSPPPTGFVTGVCVCVSEATLTVTMSQPLN